MREVFGLVGESGSENQRSKNHLRALHAGSGAINFAGTELTR